MALTGVSSLIGSDGASLIHAHKSPEKTVRIRLKMTSSFVVLSLFLIKSKELWDPVNWHVPCTLPGWNVYLWQCVLICQQWWCQWSPMWWWWLVSLEGVVFQILTAKLNRTLLHPAQVGPPCVPGSPWVLSPWDWSKWLYDGQWCPFYQKPLMYNH